MIWSSFVRSAFQSARDWGIQPSEFWGMTPAEWWAEFDFRRELQDRMNGKNAVKWSKEELERVKRK